MEPASGERSRSPIVTLVYFVLGLGAVLLLLGGVGMFLFLRTEQGQKILTLAREGRALLAEASSAPGTTELRDVGCEAALVLPAGKIADLLRQLEPAARSDEIGAGFLSAGSLPAETPVVFCSQRQPGVPDCSAAARIYSAALAQPPERFVVLMAPRQGALAGCSGVFGADGTRVEDLPPLRADGTPQAAPPL
ncbi:hypothetical protein MYXO_00760 [Myxococcaceae bacterium]|jgi:hypothetical protein|nr:hypothetical protein MYXO_00760 [Myxococcaceae bacterium]